LRPETVPVHAAHSKDEPAVDIVSPRRAARGLRRHVCTEQGLCDPDALFDARQPFATARGVRKDASCAAWHAANAPDAASACNDHGHVIRHHLTTPFFVRMGLTDVLISGNYVEAGFSEIGGGPLDLASFGRLVRADLLALSSLPTTAEEGVTVVPGVFGPICSQHETLRSDPDTYRVTIDDAGTLTRMFDVYERWVSGAGNTMIVSSTPGDTVCP
jgi:hypothetical protein